MRVVNILHVDNVDNLFLKQAFADFYYISGTHCYQQVTVYTISRFPQMMGNSAHSHLFRAINTGYP